MGEEADQGETKAQLLIVWHTSGSLWFGYWSISRIQEQSKEDLGQQKVSFGSLWCPKGV